MIFNFYEVTLLIANFNAWNPVSDDLTSLPPTR